MDFMKVLDQAVREIKREVNLKVLKVPEIEQKALDATNDEPWGPHGSALSELSRATKKFPECQIVMDVIWTRLTSTGPNWRHVYKALSVIEYLLANGSERAVDDIVEHTFQISSLTSFEYVEPNGKDVGINVRKKAETLLGLLNDKEKLQAARNKAAANRDKYVGLSSTGITYKSGSSSYGTSRFERSDQYENFSDSYKDNQFGDDGDKKYNKKDESEKFQGASSKSETKKHARHPPNKPSSVHESAKTSLTTAEDDDFNDFDPRGSSTSASTTTTTSFNQVDLFGDSLLGDLMDAPATASRETASSTVLSDDVDLFAGATFVSAAPRIPKQQDPIDLFGNQTAAVASSSSTIDLFGGADFSMPAGKPTVPPAVQAFSAPADPFASVPLTTFEEADAFGDFTSNTVPLATTLGSGEPPLKKDPFQVKSGIWADSLSRGLIDLNLAAPKKVSLSDVGVIGGLPIEAEERRPNLGLGQQQQQPFGGFY
ncbi:ENTH/VHS family protein [Wolffia australiana]